MQQVMSVVGRSSEEIAAICRDFPFHGAFVAARPHGSGHINDTYAVTFDQAGAPVRYILQRINHHVFRDVPALMENIVRVTGRIAASVAGTADAFRRNLTVLPARDGRPYTVDPAGNHWRAYLFIERAATHDRVTSPRQAYAAGRAFGEFQQHLAALGGPRLHETIPGFHDTPRRMRRFEEVLAADLAGRAREVAAEVAFAREHTTLAGSLHDLHRRGLIPERITHNDTKLNNVMLDHTSGEGICVIDLDTVMPGFAPYDFGDLIRSATNSSAEDCPDPATVHMMLPVYEAATRGFLSSAGQVLNATEIQSLPLAARLMTFEVGIRFLTDYLEGDVYFKTSRPRQNLDRCRTQFALVRSMEAQAEQMDALVADAVA